MSPPNAQVHDITAARGRRALAVIVARTDALADDRVAIIEAWREYGAVLLELRAQYPRARDFGAAVREAGLDASPAEHATTRSNAMWLGGLSDSMFSDVTKHDSNYTNPTDLRRVLRELNPDAATDKPETDGRRDPSASLIRVLHQEGLLPKNPGSACRREGVARVAEVMGVAPEEVPRHPTPDEVARIRAAARQVATFHGSAAVATIRATVDPSRLADFDAKLASATAHQVAALSAQFHTQVRKEVAARVVEKQAELDAREHELEEWADRLKARAAQITSILTLHEFKLVLGCLHPDKAADEWKERYAKAFHIFKRLEATADENVAADVLARWRRS